MDKLSIYHHLPYHLKTTAASAWGYYLHLWRYGKETDRLVEKALERDTWTSEQWKTWQDEQLARLLNHGALHVPYYQEHWRVRRKHGDQSSVELLSNWPVLSKEDLRENPQAFLADGITPRSLYEEHSSGTTGTPVRLWFSRRSIHQWYAIYEARIRRWNGLSRFDRWGIFGGQLVAPITQSKPPYWVWNQGLNQLYLSSYHISNRSVSDYLLAIKKYKLTYLLGYPSALASIAREGKATGASAPEIKLILSNAEPLFPDQKAELEDYFCCPVRNTYGMTEIAAASSECTFGNMHLFPDVGVLEVMDFQDNKVLDRGQLGRMICTGLINQDMPLIRYEVGDAGVLSVKNDCSCGRNLPILEQIEGRLDDMIITPDGRRIGRMDPVFKSNFRIKEAQIIQETIDQIRVKVVPAQGFDEAEIAELINRIQRRLGDKVNVIVESVSTIERTKNGKFKAVISRVKF